MMLPKLGSTIALESLAFYLRWSPWEFGRWRLLNLALPLSRWVLRGKHYRTVRTRYGFLLRLDQGDWLGRHVYVTGDYEPATARLIAERLQPGDLFIDVGANIGFFTLLGSRRVGPSGLVVAFEPLVRARSELEANLSRNGASNVIVRSEAVSDISGEAAYYAGPEDHQGCSSLRAIEDVSEVSRVRTIRLDDVLPTDRRVALMKIDVEGAEAKVLAGMHERLKRDRPDLIVEVTESYLNALGDSVETLCEPLFRLGYRMYAISDGGLAPVAESDASSGSWGEQFNALFTTQTIAEPSQGVADD